MNKYKEALKRLKKEVLPLDDIIYHFKEDIEILQELIEQQKTPTLEEVKKEWEEIGYEWKEVEDVISLKINVLDGIIYIHIINEEEDKQYWKIFEGEPGYLPFSFKEHQLLNKTFEALGWEEE